MPWHGFSLPVTTLIGYWSTEVVNVQAANDFVWRVDARIPHVPIGTSARSALVVFNLDFFTGTVPVGPLIVSTPNGNPGNQAPTFIWVNQ